MELNSAGKWHSSSTHPYSSI